MHLLFQPQGPPVACNTCGQKYPTRNKLFQHLKVTGHSQRMEKKLSEVDVTLDGGKGAKKKKKGKR